MNAVTYLGIASKNDSRISLTICSLFSCRKFRDTYTQIQNMKNVDKESAIAAQTIDYMSALVSNFVKHG